MSLFIPPPSVSTARYRTHYARRRWTLSSARSHYIALSLDSKTTHESRPDRHSCEPKRRPVNTGLCQVRVCRNHPSPTSTSFRVVCRLVVLESLAATQNSFGPTTWKTFRQTFRSKQQHCIFITNNHSPLGLIPPPLLLQQRPTAPAPATTPTTCTACTHRATVCLRNHDTTRRFIQSSWFTGLRRNRVTNRANHFVGCVS